MLWSFIEHNKFFTALGWAVANNLWQVGLLCIIYRIIVYSFSNLPAIIRHNLSLLILIVSFLSFLITFSLCYTEGQSIGFHSLEIIMYYTDRFRNIFSIIALSYLFFFSYKSIDFLGGYYSLLRFKQQDTTKAPASLRLFTELQRLQLGIPVPIKIWLSENIDVPSVIGYFKPVILLPVSTVTQLNTEQLEAVLLHEMAHIKRHDFLINLFQSVIMVFLCFNPFAIYISKIIDIERENCCDDWVLHFNYSPAMYANALLSLEENRLHDHSLLLAATNGKKNLLDRIKRLIVVNPFILTNRNHKLGFAFSIGIFILLLGLINPISIKPLQSLSKNKVHQLTKTQPIDLLAKKELGLLKPVSTNLTAGLISATIPVKKKNITKSVPDKLSHQKEYTIALINKDLIEGKSSETLNPAFVSSNENDNNLNITIKEETSGKDQVNMYYYKLERKNGQVKLIPMLFLNKAILNDSTADKKAPVNAHTKMRITL